MSAYSSVHRATPADWWAGARPYSWPNAITPVIVGTGAAVFYGGASWWRALLTLGVALALIIGVNYANDYSDGIRGADSDRSGPLRLTGSGIATPTAVKRAAFLAFTIAGALGTILSLSSSWWLVFIGAGCIAGAWFYTGGPHPYGYMGLGEVAVFIFFGLVGVLGTQYAQSGAIGLVGIICAVATGAISAAVMLANNLRDIPSDSLSGKITLAVRLGDTRTRLLFYTLLSIPFVCSLLLSLTTTWWALLGFLSLPLAFMAAKPVIKGATGMALIPVLGLTGRTMLVWAITTFFAWVFT